MFRYTINVWKYESVIFILSFTATWRDFSAGTGLSWYGVMMLNDSIIRFAAAHGDVDLFNEITKSGSFHGMWPMWADLGLRTKAELEPQ
jgi:hypothetical protein